MSKPLSSSLPAPLVKRIYRQLLRSAALYAREAEQREMQLGRELQRLLAAPHLADSSSPSPGASSTGGPLVVSLSSAHSGGSSPTAAASTALSLHMDKWLSKRPKLFSKFVQNSKANTSKTREATSAAASSSSPAAVTSSTESSISAASASASSSPSTLSAAPAFYNVASPVPPPAWVVSLYSSGAARLPLSSSIVRSLLRSAFRRPLPSSKPSEGSARLTLAFSLHRRLEERAQDLSLLPLTPLPSRVQAIIPGLVQVQLRSLGLFKSLSRSSNHFFHVEWNIQNISSNPTEQITLVQREITTIYRAMEKAGKEATGKQQQGESRLNRGAAADRTPRTSTSLGAAAPGVLPGTSARAVGAAPTSPHPSLSPPLPSVPPTPGSTTVVHSVPGGHRVVSQGVGLGGVAIVLPSGSSVGPHRSAVRLDSTMGTLSAKLTFIKQPGKVDSTFEVQLPPILLDAQPTWEAQVEKEEEEQGGIPARPAAQPTLRTMLSTAWQTEVASASSAAASSPASSTSSPLPSPSTPSTSSSSSSPSPPSVEETEKPTS